MIRLFKHQKKGKNAKGYDDEYHGRERKHENGSAYKMEFDNRFHNDTFKLNIIHQPSLRKDQNNNEQSRPIDPVGRPGVSKGGFPGLVAYKVGLVAGNHEFF
jgi:hypothetical protein